MLLYSPKVGLLHHLVQCFSVETIEESYPLQIFNDVRNLIVIPAFFQSVGFTVLLPEFNHHDPFILLQQAKPLEMAVQVYFPSWEIWIILIFN